MHKIDLMDDIYVNVKKYRYFQILKCNIEKQIQKMLKGGIIEQSDFPYNS
jgi:hypothetical protein